MDAFNWTCPHCERAVTIAAERRSFSHHVLSIENKDGKRIFVSSFFVCPNKDCGRLTLKAHLYKSVNTARGPAPDGEPLQSWDLVPDARSKIFPSFIPAQILEDYREACLIRDLSPKASATLARRCLQGIVRDFWSVKPGRLVDEIAAIKATVDPLTWDAIEAVRKIGNIGAHMEKDINVIVDVDRGEAALLIQLIETLLSEWYVQREERKKRMNSLISVAASKKAPIVAAPIAAQAMPAAPGIPKATGSAPDSSAP